MNRFTASVFSEHGTIEKYKDLLQHLPQEVLNSLRATMTYVLHLNWQYPVAVCRQSIGATGCCGSIEVAPFNTQNANSYMLLRTILALGMHSVIRVYMKVDKFKSIFDCLQAVTDNLDVGAKFHWHSMGEYDQLFVVEITNPERYMEMINVEGWWAA